MQPQEPDQKQAKRYYVSGRVQGVGYRYFTQETAALLGLGGYVKNLPDGRVEVYAVGTENQLKTLVSELRKGPRHAAVSEIGELDAELLVPFASRFSIDYDC